MTHDLSGKIALVTGGTRGIGRAIAAALAAAGAHVIVSSRKEPAVQQTVDALRAAGHSAEGMPSNVGRLDELHALADRVLAAHAGIDILVNNAATNPVYGPVEQTSPEAFAKIMDVNLRAPFELAKRMLPAMVARGGGSIINISSIGGVSPEPNLGIYSVSKAALLSLTQVMAKEWGARGVRVNAICPGAFPTAMLADVDGGNATVAAFARLCPLGRVGQLDELTAAVSWLSSDAASFVNGSVVVVDGGTVAW